MEQPSPMGESRKTFFRRLVIAAVIAPVLTLATLSIAASVQDVSWTIHIQNASAVERSLYGNPTVAQAEARAVSELLWSLPMGVMFGLVGALLYLWPTFLWASAQRSNRLVFGLAGAAAGLFHTGTGWAIQHILVSLPHQAQDSLLPVTTPVVMIGGFLLAGARQWATWLFLIVPACGFLVGVLSATFVRRAPATPEASGDLASRAQSPR